MKIRCTGLAAKIVEALGGTPVAMPMGETYDALSRGVVEGSLAPMESLKTWKWGEVVKFTTEDYGAAYTTGFFVVMNKAKWNALSPDIRTIILTGHGSDAEESLAAQLGAFAYLRKPVDIDILTDTMKRAYAKVNAARHAGKPSPQAEG